ncbi:MAG: TIGR00300 family protein, partial [Methanoregula sp.]|nr:TIGR00300 family protein [Methanoregula sp.]
MVVSQEIELSGHIIDSGIMTQLFDKIMDMGGNFEILVFDIGKKKTDPSYARLRVAAANREQLGFILSELHRLGARPLEVRDVHLVPAERDHVGPKGFYLTTNHLTDVKYNEEWIPVEFIEMDCLIIVDKPAKRAVCTPLSKLKKGDPVV